jgi:hypothetical protein
MTWTLRHETWIAAGHLEDRAVKSAFSFCRSAVVTQDATVETITAELNPYCDDPLLSLAPVHRLSAYQGINHRRARMCGARAWSSSLTPL